MVVEEVVAQNLVHGGYSKGGGREKHSPPPTMHERSRVSAQFVGGDISQGTPMSTRTMTR